MATIRLLRGRRTWWPATRSRILRSRSLSIASGLVSCQAAASASIAARSAAERARAASCAATSVGVGAAAGGGEQALGDRQVQGAVMRACRLVRGKVAMGFRHAQRGGLAGKPGHSLQALRRARVGAQPLGHIGVALDQRQRGIGRPQVVGDLVALVGAGGLGTGGERDAEVVVRDGDALAGGGEEKAGDVPGIGVPVLLGERAGRDSRDCAATSPGIARGCGRSSRCRDGRRQRGATDARHRRRGRPSRHRRWRHHCAIDDTRGRAERGDGVAPEVVGAGGRRSSWAEVASIRPRRRASASAASRCAA